MKKTLVLGFTTAILLVGCQTNSNISPHYNGARVKPISASQSVTLEKIPAKEKFLERCESLNQQGYTMLGRAIFTGLQDGPEKIKNFAARH